MVKVKICGLTGVEEAKALRASGADMMGVIVNAKIPTPRNLNYKDARGILSKAPSGIERVAVGMPEDLREGLEIIDELDPDYLQMHSYPSLSEVRELNEITDKKLIMTLPIDREVMDSSVLAARAQEIAEVSDFLLLDTKLSYKGMGKTHDWSVSRKIRDVVDTPAFLAGGLTPSNVRSAIEEVRPYGVDVASGVEKEPGKKDPKKVRAFIKASKEI